MSVHRFPGPAPDMAALDAALSKRTGYYRQAAEVRQRVRAHQAAKAQPGPFITNERVKVLARFGAWALLAAGVALGLLIAISIFYFLVLLPRGVQVGLGLGTGASLLAVAALRSFEAL